MNADSDRRDLTVAGVFDIETEDWDRFVCGGMLCADGSYFSVRHDEEDRLVTALLGASGTWWAHSGGTFDFKWITDRAIDRGIKPSRVILSGSSAVSVTIGKATFRDSHALFKISLANLTASQGIAKEKLDLPCVCGDDCGGYCSIKRDMTPEYWDRVMHYLEKDNRSLLEAINSFREYARELDIDLCGTVGASAWRTARRQLGLIKDDLSPGEFNFARSSYYGGRVQVFRQQADRGWGYDVNSMYPASLAKVALPVGSHRESYGGDAERELAQAAPGVYDATIVVPDMHIPPLPYRVPDRVAYPVGTMRGIWTLPEIEGAVRAGAVVQAAHKSLTWEGSERIFAPFVDRFWTLRHKAGKKTPLGTWIKFILNSLTGKLGSNPSRETIEFDPEIKECNADRPCSNDGKRDCHRCCNGIEVDCKRIGCYGCVEGVHRIGVHCSGRCGAHRPIDKDRGIWTRRQWRIEECAHPAWAAYLTAVARVSLGDQLRDDGQGGRSAVYCDTDSCRAISPRTANIGDDLGQWGLEGTFRNFRALAPKVYRLEWDRPENSLEPEIKAKGVYLPKSNNGREIIWRKLIAGELAGKPRHGLVGFRRGARDGAFFQAAKRERRIIGGTGDRILVNSDSGGMTRPPTMEEAENGTH